MKSDVALPSKEHEKEALESATDYFRIYAAGLKPEGSKHLYRYWSEFMLKEIYDNQPQQLDVLANTANPILARDLREFAATLIERGEPLPESWRWRVAEFLRNPEKWKNTRQKRKNKRGPSGTDLVIRNITIAGQIQRIVDKWNFPATRNETTKELAKHASAASIVKEALKRGAGIRLGEAAINKIWGEYKIY
jgi:hypothetical protein